MQYPGAVTLINKAEYWSVSKLERRREVLCACVCVCVGGGGVCVGRGAIMLDSQQHEITCWTRVRSSLVCHHPAAQQFLMKHKPEPHSAKKRPRKWLMLENTFYTLFIFPTSQWQRGETLMTKRDKLACWINLFVLTKLLFAINEDNRVLMMFDMRTAVFRNIHSVCPPCMCLQRKQTW